ncbi:MAG: 50S ribosomal protein L3 [Candidatus Thermoplasmatota archaeon]|nr:50S ribosomal protein L3 [Candidatus Thermoplasmatota archaeon]
MATPHHPRRGSTGYYPRVRKKGLRADVRSWPELDGKPSVEGFAGYKVGMTHVEMVDYRKYSTTAGQSIVSAATVVEVPPLKVLGIRYYGDDYRGKVTIGETWADNIPKELNRRIPVRKEKNDKQMDTGIVSDVRMIVCTNPNEITGLPKKVPDIFELPVTGNTVKEKEDYVKSFLGKDISFSEFSAPGKFVDVIAVTKGKGFQGSVKRFGVKLLSHKNRKHRRMIGTLGPWHPDWVRNTVPQAGQVGSHQRTAHNIRVLHFGTKNDTGSINVKGGFLSYGLVRNDYVLLHGSIPGPSKRLIKMRVASRQQVPDSSSMSLSYISLESKQGD